MTIKVAFVRRVNFTCPEGYVIETPGVLDEQTNQE